MGSIITCRTPGDVSARWLVLRRPSSPPPRRPRRSTRRSSFDAPTAPRRLLRTRWSVRAAADRFGCNAQTSSPLRGGEAVCPAIRVHLDHRFARRGPAPEFTRYATGFIASHLCCVRSRTSGATRQKFTIAVKSFTTRHLSAHPPVSGSVKIERWGDLFRGRPRSKHRCRSALTPQAFPLFPGPPQARGEVPGERLPSSGRALPGRPPVRLAACPRTRWGRKASGLPEGKDRGVSRESSCDGRFPTSCSCSRGAALEARCP